MFLVSLGYSPHSSLSLECELSSVLTKMHYTAVLDFCVSLSVRGLVARIHKPPLTWTGALTVSS